MTIDDLPIQMVKITGTPGNGYWSQIHTFTPEKPDETISRGTLLATITVATDKQGVEAVSYGRDILGRLHEEYFGNKQDSAFTCLKRAVERITAESPESQMAAAVILDNKLILAVSPKATVWLNRENSFGQLSTSKETVEMLAGELLENDTFLMSSSVFNQAVPAGTLKTALVSGLDQAGEIVGPIVLGHEQSGGAVGLIFRVKEGFERTNPVEIEKVAPVSGEAQYSETPIVTFPDHSPREIYLKRVRLQRLTKKLVPLVATGLGLLLLVIGIGRVIGKISQSRRLAKSNVLITELKAKTQEGIRTINDDLSEVNELVAELENQVEAIDSLKLPETDEYQQIKKQIADLKNQAGQTGYIKEPTVYMDLGLVGDGIEGKGVVSIGKNLLVLSNEGKKLVVFETAKKSYKENPLQEDYSLIAAGNNRVYLVSGNSIAEYNLVSGGERAVVSDAVWEQTDSLAVYLGNIYVLDTKKPSIWRFPAIEGGFGVGKNWLKEEVDLSNSVDLAVDGSVWVLDKNTIRKFNVGKPESFSVGAEGYGISDARMIYTTAENEELLVLDKSNGRLYRIKKDGSLVKSYQSPVFKNTISLTSDGTKAYLLDGKKIYEVELN